jgi:hypothetical protein
MTYRLKNLRTYGVDAYELAAEQPKPARFRTTLGHSSENEREKQTVRVGCLRMDVCGGSYKASWSR